MTPSPLSALISLKTPGGLGTQVVVRKFLRYAAMLALLQGLSSPVFSQAPAGWKLTQDMNKACQIAFPSTWSVTPDGQASTPTGGRAVLVVGSDRPLTPMTPDYQKLLQVDRMIENSSKRVFYIMKPQGDKLQYVVDQQFKTGRCRLQLTIPKGYSEDEAMKIVATLGSTH